MSAEVETLDRLKYSTVNVPKETNFSSRLLSVRDNRSLYSVFKRYQKSVSGKHQHSDTVSVC